MRSFRKEQIWYQYANSLPYGLVLRPFWGIVLRFHNRTKAKLGGNGNKLVFLPCNSTFPGHLIFGAMTIGFVALTDKGIQPAADLQWLRYLLEHLRAANPKLRLLLFTNHAAWNPLPGVEVVSITAPRNWWQRLTATRKWPALLAQQGADRVVFWGMEGLFRTPLPQSLVLTATDFNQKRVIGLRKAGYDSLQLFVANEAARANLQSLLGEKRSISVLRGQLPHATLQEVDDQVVKNRFTEGAEFFLYQGPLQDTASTVNLLKAFSRFKHRQKSGWKLVLLPEGEGASKELQQLLATYKYRHDVVLAEGLHAETLESVYAAAWCFVYPATPGYRGGSLLRALQWRLPLVGTEACREWAGNSGLYFEAGNEVQLADHLMRIYKDENICRQLREAAMEAQATFSWQPLEQWLKG